MFADVRWVGFHPPGYLVTELVFTKNNEVKSPASFCHQVAAWFPDMYCKFNLAKNHKVANNSATTKAI